MKAEHRFVDQTFTKPAFCGHCKQLLWGLRNQGLQCAECGVLAHRKKCEALLQGAGCKGAAAAPAVAAAAAAASAPTVWPKVVDMTASSDDLSSSSSGGSAHDFVLTTFTGPTFCYVCRAFLWGLAKQGLRCNVCGRAVHKKCRRRAKRCGDVDERPGNSPNNNNNDDKKGVVLDNELIEALRREG
jgi:novel protein kinase C theta type